ncbi:DUF443 family protein [Staphylococcus warneri]|uniref:DUF443 family protein n=1 Tax=Staphylococcus warneri TaxID=1292 RepID=UPI00292873E8|nr:DUF443 family protein [Staphylococcus warneri]MDU9352043.1 DUF443 family protein [Staphylococcus warneri]
MKGHIDFLPNNIRYKIFTVDRQIYLIDLQQNYISYIIPMINWLPLNAKKINMAEYKALTKDSNTNTHKHSQLPLVIGSSVLIPVLLRPLIKISNIPINFITALILVLITLSSIILLQYKLKRKNEISISNLSNTNCKLKIKPSYKHMATILILFLFLIFTFLVGLDMLLIQHKLNYIIFGFWIILLVFHSFLNTMSLNIGSVESKIYD